MSDTKIRGPVWQAAWRRLLLHPAIAKQVADDVAETKRLFPDEPAYYCLWRALDYLGCIPQSMLHMLGRKLKKSIEEAR